MNKKNVWPDLIEFDELHYRLTLLPVETLRTIHMSDAQQIKQCPITDCAE